MHIMLKAGMAAALLLAHPSLVRASEDNTMRVDVRPGSNQQTMKRPKTLRIPEFDNREALRHHSKGYRFRDHSLERGFVRDGHKKSETRNDRYQDLIPGRNRRDDD